jgi:hypothetical protein
MGKGFAIKAGDETCYPACGPRPGIHGCHWLIGTSGRLTKSQRRRLEAAYAADTREALRDALASLQSNSAEPA